MVLVRTWEWENPFLDAEEITIIIGFYNWEEPRGFWSFMKYTLASCFKLL